MIMKKYVVMDMLPDGYYGGGGISRRITVTEVKKELSLQEQLKLIKEDEKPKEKQSAKFQIKL